MRYSMVFPTNVPVPAVGQWMYLVIPDYSHPGIEYHTCGVVEANGPDWGNENWVTYKNSWLPPFANRPIKPDWTRELLTGSWQ